jgi:hypothetical protein
MQFVWAFIRERYTPCGTLRRSNKLAAVSIVCELRRHFPIPIWSRLRFEVREL